MSLLEPWLAFPLLIAELVDLFFRQRTIMMELSRVPGITIMNMHEVLEFSVFGVQ